MKARASRLSGALTLALGLAAAGRAQEAPLSAARARQLFNAHGCNACHAVDEARIGPPYRAVALRYANAPPATLDWLAAKIVAGGAGSWGVIPMVSNPRLAPSEARAAARWILALATASNDAAGEPAARGDAD